MVTAPVTISAPVTTPGTVEAICALARDDAHIAVFDLLRKEMLSDASLTAAQTHIEQVLSDRQRAEDLAARDAVSGADVKRLDQELSAVRQLPLRPAALAAAVAEIEQERAELLAKASGKRDQRESRSEEHT